LLIILASFWAIGTIGTAFAPNFAGLFAARLIAGIGAGTAFPVLISLLADVCMPDRRGRSMLLVSIGAWAGAAAAFAIGGSLFGYLTSHPGA
ncbi:MFS transporter, partial [Escherichia coli]|nr:MFS transporter [Escherichia coli]